MESNELEIREAAPSDSLSSTETVSAAAPPVLPEKAEQPATLAFAAAPPVSRTPFWKRKTTKIIALGSLTLLFVVLEIVIGYISGSLALVADAFHALSDFLALVIAYQAVKLAARKMPELPSVDDGEDSETAKALKTAEQQLVRHKTFHQLTFGLQRAEVLGALVNATFLLSLCFSIFVQAIERFYSIASEGEGKLSDPKLVLAVGCAGLCLNLFGMWMFHDHSHHGHDHAHGHSHSHEQKKESTTSHSDHAHSHSDSDDHSHSHSRSHSEDSNSDPSASHSHSHKDLNAYGVFLHVAGDALGSLAVIVSSLIVWLASGAWRFYMDPLVSVLFTLLITVTTFPLARRAARILLLATPPSLPLPDLKRALLTIPGVLDLHEVHVFELKSGLFVASLHMVLEDRGNYPTIAGQVRRAMHKFGIHATTVQPEFVKPVLKGQAVEYVPSDPPGYDKLEGQGGLEILAGLPLPVVEPPAETIAEVSCIMRCTPTFSASTGDGCEIPMGCGVEELCCEPGVSERGRLRRLEEAEKAIEARRRRNGNGNGNGSGNGGEV